MIVISTLILRRVDVTLMRLRYNRARKRFAPQGGGMPHVLLLFLDGVGLGEEDAAHNPFVTAHTPTLRALSGGRTWLRDVPRLAENGALFVPTDACLGVGGRPQSATGQAAILTGRNVPALLGEHYGPRPNPPIRELVARDNLFKRVIGAGGRAALLNAFPPRFFERLASGKRLPSSVQHAALTAGVPLRTEADIYAGRALSPDWTGEGWRSELGYTDTPLYTPHEAGQRLAALAREYDFAMFSHWVSDVVGHRGPLARGVALLETFDGVLAGLLDAWDVADGLIVITSDHGNLEDLSTRTHTRNPVPTVAIGAGREVFAEGLRDLTDITGGILRVLGLHTREGDG